MRQILLGAGTYLLDTGNFRNIIYTFFVLNGKIIIRMNTWEDILCHLVNNRKGRF